MVNWKNVLGTSVLSAGLLFSSFGSFGSTASAQTLKDSLKTRSSVVHIDKQKSLPFLDSAPGSTFDPGLVNEDKVLDMLIKEGKVSKNASKAKQLEQAQAYFKNRSAKAEQLTHSLGLDNPKQVRSNIQEQQGLQKKPAKAPNSNTLSDHSAVKGTSVDPIQKEDWNGAVRTDKVLVLLIEYPDLKHNNITPDENPVLLYDDFTRQHYQDMIFGKNGYAGPNGENYISVKQFYEQQSGGSYTIDGQVSKWYTADHPAAYYGGNSASGSDSHPRDLIKEALDDAAQDTSINLADYDQEDPFDLDGDGNLREPDGIIDHLMVVHSGIGEEAGGGSLGEDAIWSHSSQVYELINGAAYPYEITGSDYSAWGYTVEPEDGAAGVFAHEYGHNLGLPDDYDTLYTANSVGAPTGFWTIMSSGSWGGTVPGTEPTGFAAKDKEFLQESMPESNWFHDQVFNLDDLKDGTKLVNLDEASVKGKNADGIRINLPDKATAINTPTSGDYEYFGGGVDNADLYMTTSSPVDLTNATNAALTFKTWYSFEQDFDYGYVAVSDDNGDTWTNIPGNITTNDDPNEANQGNGITGSSGGKWLDATFDLSDYAGKTILVSFQYAGDPYYHEAGFYLDDINITADGKTVLSDNADSDTSSFELDGFKKDTGKKYTEQYYLIEWRNYADADTALEHINRGGKIMSYEPGMIVWYYDSFYGEDNWVGNHPGDGFLGVVDAHQTPALWSGKINGAAGTDYQIADASFSLNQTKGISLDLSEDYGRILSLDPQPAATVFDDSRDYSEPGQIYAGRNVPNFGLKVHVVGQADDMSVGQLALHVGDDHSITLDPLTTNEFSGADGHNNVAISGTLHEDGNGETVAVKYDLVDSNDNIVQTSEEETVDGLYQTFSHTFTISSNLASGDYKVKVTATDVDGNSQSADKTITVDNTAPTVTPELPNGNNTGASSKDASVKVVLPDDVNPTTLEYVWSQSAKAPVSGWTSFNNGDTLTLSGKDGTWYLHVRAQDKLGNPVDWTSNAFTVDNTAPVITLKGDNPLTVEQGSKFKDPGFTVKDNVDNNLASKVVVTGTVDTSKIGEYTLTYTVTDAAGNKTVVTRTVKVVKKSTNNGGTTNNGSGSNGGTTSDNGNLPSTATDMYNFMTGGILSIALAAALLFVSRRRKRLV